MYDNIHWMKLNGQNGQGESIADDTHGMLQLIEFKFYVKHSQYKYETWHHENIWIYYEQIMAVWVMKKY